MLPPTLIRRLVLAPLVIVIGFGFIVLSPFLALLALVAGLLARARAGHMRSLRLVGFALVWFVAETVTLIALAGLWVVSGFGGRLRTEPYQSRHYGVMRWFLDTMYSGAERTYGLRVEVDEPELTGDELAARLTRPVIVLSRHAGPGDSFLLVHQLLSVYHRRPRVVMKAALQLDPSVDIVGNRLPNVWIKSRQAGEHIFTEQIARLARGLDQRGALVIFPEGGNWTPGRWRRGIRRLEHLGRPDLAERARDMPNLLPPRPGGALAAIAACPDADVIFVAHAGLDNIVTVGDVWGSSRSIRSSGLAGGGCQMIPYPVRPTMRPRSSGCTTGGNGSMSGSPRTGPAGCRRWRSCPGTTRRNRPGSYRPDPARITGEMSPWGGLSVPCGIAGVPSWGGGLRVPATPGHRPGFPPPRVSRNPDLVLGLWYYDLILCDY